MFAELAINGCRRSPGAKPIVTLVVRSSESTAPQMASANNILARNNKTMACEIAYRKTGRPLIGRNRHADSSVASSFGRFVRIVGCCRIWKSCRKA
jgi:hypothetical protein